MGANPRRWAKGVAQHRGTAQVNLRGLGSNRTLVLLNGRRVVYGGTGANSAVDLNMIPTSLIDRIEVLKDGASALYGADAVAGVVNIVTKSDFQGLDFETKYGQTTESDGEELSASVTFGVANEKGSLMAALSYLETEEINMADREECGLAVSGDQLVCSGSASTSGGRATYLTGPSRGSHINFNQVEGGDGDFYEPYVPAVHNIPYFHWLNAVNPIEKTTVALFGDYNVAENTRFFAEALFTDRQTSQIATPATLQSYYVPGVGISNFNIPAAERQDRRLNVLGATSGDTGSAAEHALKGKSRVSVFMLSPQGRMSPFQRAQMYALQDANIFNIAVEGVFDDCQDVVKAVNADAAFKERHAIGAVNSIN